MYVGVVVIRKSVDTDQENPRFSRFFIYHLNLSQAAVIPNRASCTSMRIGTDGEQFHREDTIENLRALERDDLTHAQRRELADVLSTRHFSFEFEIKKQRTA